MARVPMASPTVTAMATLMALCRAFHSGSCRCSQRTIGPDIVSYRFRTNESPGGRPASGIYQQGPPRTGIAAPTGR